MFTYSTMAGAAICALVASPVIANTVVPEMPWYATLGVNGMLGTLLYWSMKHGDERTAKSLGEVKGSLDGVKTEITGLRDDMREGTD